MATLGEAETFVRLGVRDVFVAYPLWLEERTAGRLRDLTADARVAIGVDSVAGRRAPAGCSAARRVEVLVEVDSRPPPQRGGPGGGGHGGRRPRAAPASPCAGSSRSPGHSYAPDATRSAAADEAAALATAADGAAGDGHRAPRSSAAAPRPSLEHTDTGVVTELRPGVYVFGDAQQWELGTTTPERIALACRATVVSHAGGRLVLDAGSKVLGADRAAYASGFGRLPAHPDARVVLLSEHHAVVDLAGAPLPELGSRVDVVPNHVCAAVNLVDDLYVEEAGQLRPWPVTARGLNA